jgi:hypothetical protein
MNPAELWARIVSAPRPSDVVDFPRKGPDGEPLCKVAIMLLSQDEQILASAETERFTKKAIKELPKSDEPARGYHDVYNNRGAVEVLYRAVRVPGELTKPFFPSPDEIQRALTPDEVGTLFRAYLIVQAELGPVISRMDKDETDAWVRKLREAGSRSPLASLSWEALSELVFSLASQTESSATSSTSLGEPHGTPSSNTTGDNA